MNKKRIVSLLMLIIGVLEIALFWVPFYRYGNSQYTVELSLKQILDNKLNQRFMAEYVYAMMIIIPIVLIVCVLYDLISNNRYLGVKIICGIVSIFDLYMSFHISQNVTEVYSGSLLKPNFGIGFYLRILLDLVAIVIDIWIVLQSIKTGSIEKEEFATKEVIGTTSAKKTTKAIINKTEKVIVNSKKNMDEVLDSLHLETKNIIPPKEKEEAKEIEEEEIVIDEIVETDKPAKIKMPHKPNYASGNNDEMKKYFDEAGEL